MECITLTGSSRQKMVINKYFKEMGYERELGKVKFSL